MANSYFVTTTGNDGNSGSQSAPWLTVAHAAQVAQAGDTVYVGAGTYNGVVQFNQHSGTVDKPITFQPVSGQTVFLTSTGSGTVVVTGESYITVTGFNITNADPNDGQGGSGGDGVLMVYGANHVTISNCYVHDCGAGGIVSLPNGPTGAGLGCDYLTVSYNNVANCCHTSGGHGSGISLFGLANQNPSDLSPHDLVEHNVVYLNAEVATLPAGSYGYGGPHTDGNGIIMDTCGNGPPILIAYNVCYGNGGRGVYACVSDNCDFVNNTCYENVQDSTLYNPSGTPSLGELAVCAGSNNTFTNNIAYAHGGYDYANIVFTYPGATSSNNTFSNNCYYSGSATYGTGDIYANPMFMNASAGDFLLAVGSPAAGDGAFPTPVLPTRFTVSAPATVTAGSPFNVTVTAYDSTGNVAMAYGGTLHFSSTDAKAVLPPNTTLSNGTGVFSATLSTAGTQTIAATDTTSSSVTGSTTATVTTLNGTYELTPANATGSRLDAYESGTATGTNVDIWANNGTGAQKWVFTNEGGRIYKIQPSYDLSLCLDVIGSGGSGTNCDLYQDNGSNAQRWAVTQNSDGTYTIVPQCAPSCALDVYSSGTANGTQVNIYSANGTNAQKWALSH